MVQVINPAITPLYDNNPGFGVLAIDNLSYKVNYFRFTFLKLQDLLNYDIISWKKFDPSRYYGFDLNAIDQVESFQWWLFDDMNIYADWEAQTYGFPAPVLNTKFLTPSEYSAMKDR